MVEKKTDKIIINAENAVVGRLASWVAKQALLGKQIVVVNSEKSIVLGREKNVLERYREKRSRGGSSQKGPFFPSNSEKIMKRSVRGMLPYKKARGRRAYKRVKCFNSIPEEFKNEKMIKSGRGKEGITLKKISKMLRGGK